MLNEKNLSIVDSPVSAQSLGELLDMMAKGTISGKIAKDVFAEMSTSGKSAAAIVKEKGLEQISDPSVIEPVVDAVLAAEAAQVALYHDGKKGLFGFFVGEVLKATKGKASPQVVNELLRRKLQQN